MTARDDAIAALASATSTDILGVEMIIDGGVVQAVRRSLTIEEAVAFSGGGFAGGDLAVEGCRLTIDSGLLANQPIVGGSMTVDDVRYDVSLVTKIGSLLRVTLTRYLA